MTERTLTHSTFVLEREYKVPPAKVFQAFADPAIKATWFDDPGGDWTLLGSTSVREGGHEYNESRFGADGPVSRFDARYHEIVEDLRIVYSYEMRADGARLSRSRSPRSSWPPSPAGTLLTLTEQGVYLDGLDNTGQRERGMRELLEALAGAVEPR